MGMESAYKPANGQKYPARQSYHDDGGIHPRIRRHFGILRKVRVAVTGTAFDFGVSVLPVEDQERGEIHLAVTVPSSTSSMCLVSLSDASMAVSS